MSDEDTVTLDVRGLDKLLKALKQKPPVARIGILGDSTARGKKEGRKETATNAEIGAAHEFGSPARNIPQRSFLRIPISEHLDKELEKSGAISEKETKEVIKAGTTVPWLQKIAVLAEGIVKEAFNSRGYGKWAAWKDPAYKNNAGMVLVDSSQLRDSITSEVKE